MATFFFDRLCKILSKPVEPDGIKPYFESEEDRKERKELLNKCLQKWKEKRQNNGLSV